MQVKNEAQTGLNAEIKIIPPWAWTVAAIIFVAAEVFFNFYMHPGWAGVPLGLAAGTIAGGYWLLVGYVNRDARRRGMSSLLWTLVAIFIPNCLGILLYFLLRQPLQTACAQCGNTVQTGFNFCPRCSCQLSSSCPKCQRVVGGNDVYCPYCGTSLRNQTVPA
jgi:RNA polymerase subunit RPABC4/transcription elongation factor Spt4